MLPKALAGLAVAVALTGAGLYYADPGLFAGSGTGDSGCPLSALTGAASSSCSAAASSCALSAASAKEGVCPHSLAASLGESAETCPSKCAKAPSDVLAACMGVTAVSAAGGEFHCCAEVEQ